MPDVEKKSSEMDIYRMSYKLVNWLNVKKL